MLFLKINFDNILLAYARYHFRYNWMSSENVYSPVTTRTAAQYGVSLLDLLELQRADSNIC